MSKAVQVRGVRLGEGIPKICVPLTGVTPEEVVEEAALLCQSKADLAEWRVDHFADAQDSGAVTAMLKRLREALGDLPLLFTFRTGKEGGRQVLPLTAYLALNKKAAATGLVDLLDVEYSAGEDVCRELITAAHANQVAVVMSSHDFQGTPLQQEMVSLMRDMRRMGGDIPKVAVMPQSAADVLALLAAGEQYARDADCPVITVSMSQLGCVSRIAGELSGSCLTFGTVSGASAPGQLSADDVYRVLHLLHGWQ